MNTGRGLPGAKTGPGEGTPPPPPGSEIDSAWASRARRRGPGRGSRTHCSGTLRYPLTEGATCCSLLPGPASAVSRSERFAAGYHTAPEKRASTPPPRLEQYVFRVRGLIETPNDLGGPSLRNVPGKRIHPIRPRTYGCSCKCDGRDHDRFGAGGGGGGLAKPEMSPGRAPVLPALKVLPSRAEGRHRVLRRCCLKSTQNAIA